MEISGKGNDLPLYSDSTSANHSEAHGKKKQGRPKKGAFTRTCNKVVKPKNYVVKFLIHEAYKGVHASCLNGTTEHPIIIEVTNTQGLAEEWGRIKNNPKMNYDKLSRGLRYYNNKGLIQNPNRKIFIPDMTNPETCKHWSEAISEYTQESKNKAPHQEDIISGSVQGRDIAESPGPSSFP